MKIIFTLISLLLVVAPLWAGTKIDVFPTVRYDQFLVYETLALFWLGIIGLVVIIRMKLKEIERVQRLKIDEEEDNIPYLG